MLHEPRLAIIIDLLRRVENLAEQRNRLSVSHVHDELDRICHVSHAFALHDVERLASLLQSALCLHGLGPVVLSYIDLLRQAIAAEMPVADSAMLSAADRTGLYTAMHLPA